MSDHGIIREASPGGWRVWWESARPKTLWAGISPVLIGTAMAYADGGLDWGIAALCLLTGVSVQIGANYSNDYFDFVNGTDTAERLGPRRATASGLVSPKTMRLAFCIAYGVTMVSAALLAWRAGWWVLLLGALCVICGILYTGGPWPLGYNGLGDVFAFVFFGPIAVACTHYFQTLNWSAEAWLAGVAPGLFAVAILTVNNLRDIDQDAKGGKHTLAVMFGRGFARAEYLVSVAVGGLVPMGLYLYSDRGPWLFLPLLIGFPAVRAINIVYSTTDGPALNRALALTGKMELLHSFLFATALVLA